MCLFVCPLFVFPEYLTIFQNISLDKESSRLGRLDTLLPQSISLDKESSRPGRLDTPRPGA